MSTGLILKFKNPSFYSVLHSPKVLPHLPFPISWIWCCNKNIATNKWCQETSYVTLIKQSLCRVQASNYFFLATLSWMSPCPFGMKYNEGKFFLPMNSCPVFMCEIKSWDTKISPITDQQIFFLTIFFISYRLFSRVRPGRGGGGRWTYSRAGPQNRMQNFCIRLGTAEHEQNKFFTWDSFTNHNSQINSNVFLIAAYPGRGAVPWTLAPLSFGRLKTKSKSLSVFQFPLNYYFIS